MIFPKDFRIDKRPSFNLYHLDLSETNYKREQLIEELNVFKEFRDRFNCTTNRLIGVLNNLNALDNDLFEYTTTKTPYLVGKDVFYTMKRVRVEYTWQMKKTHYDVYITSNSFVNLILNKAAMLIVGDEFPYLCKEPFTMIVKRFKDNINKLPKSTNVKLNKIDSSIIFDNDMTINDLIKLYADETYKDSYITKPRYIVYSDGTDVYITIDKEKGYSLHATIEQLKNRDWKAIEENEIRGCLLYDSNGDLIPKKWFYGMQKDAPYFNHPIVAALKEFLTKE